ECSDQMRKDIEFDGAFSLRIRVRQDVPPTEIRAFMHELCWPGCPSLGKASAPPFVTHLHGQLAEGRVVDGVFRVVTGVFWPLLATEFLFQLSAEKEKALINQGFK
ncbi:hypothetical protein, partial [Klebsiella pneumoniae]|uniref:hypothetical protein n=1 Tax=Klebsiella pneumoniae TaxID=573 RepID=UPI00256F2AFC